MHIQEYIQAYELFIALRAEHESRDIEDVKSEIGPEAFEQQVRYLHQQWMSGEMSFGRFSELIGVPHWELWEILRYFDLPLHS